MTQAALGGVVFFPIFYTGTSADSATTLDAAGAPDNGVAGDYQAMVIKIPATGTIDKVTIRLGTTAATGGNATLSCRIFSLDASGDPDDDAVYGSCTQQNYALTGTDDNTFVTFSGLACSATKGDYVAVTVWLSALVTTASAGITYGAGMFLSATPAHSFPYTTTRTTGTGAGTHAAIAYGFSLEYSGGVFYDIGFGPAATHAAETIDSDGTLRRVGNRFILPVPLVACGAWVVLDNDTDTTSIKLYDTDGTTVLATTTLVAANRIGSAGGWAWHPFDGAAVTLSANTASPYRIVAETNNTSATAAGLRNMTVSAASHLNQISGGSAWHYTSHNGTAWSDTATKRTHIGLMVSQVDDGNGLGRASLSIGV